MSNAPSANDQNYADRGPNKDDTQIEPPLLQNKVGAGIVGGAAKPPLAANTSPSSTQNKVNKVSSMTVSANDANDVATKKGQPVASPKAAQQRRSSDGKPQGPTIANVRDLLLGDTIEQSRQELEHIEQKTNDQVCSLREEMGDRIDRVVRALSSVNQAVHKEFSAREEAVRESSATLTAKSEELATKMEDRLSFLEAKIYTVVADMERKVSATQLADKDKLVEQLAESNVKTENRLTELTKQVESQLESFGSRITTEIAGVSDSLEAAQVKASSEAEELGEQVGKRLGTVEVQLNAELKELRQDIETSSMKLQSELSAQAAQQRTTLAKTQEETQAKLQEHVQGLEGRKVSRSDFSVLLQELALRLDDEDGASSNS